MRTGNRGMGHGQNDADWGLAGVLVMTLPAPYEISTFLGSGGEYGCKAEAKRGGIHDPGMGALDPSVRTRF